MKYILSQQLIDEVKAGMASYFTSHRANEAMLYGPLMECLSQMGTGILEEDTALIHIEGSQADLPEDFEKLCYAVGCFEWEMTRPVPNIGTQEKRVEACAVDIQKGFDVQVGPNGLEKVIQYLPYETFSWSDFEVLRLVKPVKTLTADGCPNTMARSQNEIEIKNGKITTNFETGTIYIEYLKNPISVEGIQIPDQPKILTWIKQAMRTAVLDELYINGEPDILQRLQYAQNRLTIAEMRAMQIYKRSEFTEFYGLRNRLMARYKALAKPMMTNERRYHKPWT